MLTGLLIGIIIVSLLIFIMNPSVPAHTEQQVRENMHRSYVRMVAISVFVITLCVLLGYIASSVS